MLPSPQSFSPAELMSASTRSRMDETDRGVLPLRSVVGWLLPNRAASRAAKFNRCRVLKACPKSKAIPERTPESARRDYRRPVIRATSVLLLRLRLRFQKDVLIPQRRKRQGKL